MEARCSYDMKCVSYNTHQARSERLFVFHVVYNIWMRGTVAKHDTPTSVELLRRYLHCSLGATMPAADT